MRIHNPHNSFAGREDSLLLVIDIQERLIDSIQDRDELIVNTKALIKAAEVFDLPVLVTEQRKLGQTVSEIKELLSEYGLYNPIEKMHFSCFRERGFAEMLKRTPRSDILICGIEAHICVMQTALDLLENHYRVHLVRDAVSSHREMDYLSAVNRLRDNKAVVTTTETVIYELLGKAGTEEFKEILEVVKERRGSLPP